MPRITILTGNHLCHNPRVIKEASTLADAGFSVRVLGASFDKSLKLRDSNLQISLPFRFQPVLDGTEYSRRWWHARMSQKVGSIAHGLVGIESRRQLGYSGNALYREALCEAADLYIAHSEPALASAAKLLHRGRHVGIDMEDWFSEDLALQVRAHRPVRLLRELEGKLLTGDRHATCPSFAMSRALASEFGCPRPTVVYNAFPWSDRRSIDGDSKDRGNRELLSIHWFSQTLGHGRGIEDLIAALPLLKQEAEIHLRGNPVAGFEKWLMDRLPERWRARVVVHGLVSNQKLLSRISEHDIGFAGETSLIRSRDLTVTNKILQYLLGGLAVVASDTAGQREVSTQAPGGVFLYTSGNAVELAERLDALLGSTEALRRAKGAALDAARLTFCWERQERALLDSVSRALHAPAMPLGTC